jgi:type IV fimbrial biogenesis protein FimT
MRNNSGFTLLELMIALALAAIVASVAVPSFFTWRSEAKLRSAVSMIRGDLEMARSRAMRENNFVAVLFNTTNYLVFIDDGAGGGNPGDYIRHADERLLRNRQLPSGVTIDLTKTDFEDDQTRFNGRGRIGRTGKVIIVNPGGVERIIDANNRFGRITVN